MRGEAKAEPTKISASRGLVDWLATHRISIALTSYQTGQLMLIGALPRGSLSVYQRNFVRAMGLCADAQRIYLSAIAQVWRLDNVLKQGQVANKQFDRLYVPRNAQTTGDLDIHEIAVGEGGSVVFVNTKYSCLATLDPVHSFKPLWRPRFIGNLAPEDRCHLNGLAMRDGRPKFVTAVSRSDVVDGWRERRHEGGVIIDVETNRIVTEDLSMPHSPRLANGKLWVLDSGRGYLCRVDEASGKIERVAFCPGFLRGLSFWRHFALVATSLPRDSSFRGLELDDNIKARDGEPRCGAFIVDTRNGDILHWIRFDGAVRELFDAAFIPGVRAPMCVGLASPEFRTLITMPDDGGAPFAGDAED
ncbi:TIGR03032 family protein [Methyloceanibacter sp.]|uniref:TIGR03032 family protein n=1 Tax=Methyloceanibacter sp. TaxID=1965321 RepID=UPI003D6D4644